MSKNTSVLKKKFLITGLIVVACLTAIGLARQMTGPRGELFPDRRIVARAKGNPKADLWIVEFVDFQCGTCRTASLVMKEYLSKYPTQFYLQVRFHPLEKTHPHAMQSAIFADCASRQNKFWPYETVLFERQEEWIQSPDPTDQFHAYGQTVGLDRAKLDACVEDPATRERIAKEKGENEALGVRATPTFFINGKMVVGTKALKEVLDPYFSGQQSS